MFARTDYENLKDKFDQFRNVLLDLELDQVIDNSRENEVKKECGILGAQYNLLRLVYEFDIELNKIDLFLETSTTKSTNNLKGGFESMTHDTLDSNNVPLKIRMRKLQDIFDCNEDFDPTINSSTRFSHEM